jgi:hypothetical protein
LFCEREAGATTREDGGGIYFMVSGNLAGSVSGEARQPLRTTPTSHSDDGMTKVGAVFTG